MSNRPQTSTVYIGAAADTGPSFTLTINRDRSDALTDWTTATTVVLVLPDASTKAVTKTSGTTAQWIGAVKYNAWWSTPGVYTVHAKATFQDGTTFTLPDPLTFSVAQT